MNSIVKQQGAVLLFLVLAMSGVGCPSSPTPEGQESSPSSAVTPEDRFVMFALNVQDFSYPDMSAEVVERVLTIHERYNVPVDVYLTGSIASLFEDQHPALLEHVRTSTVAAVSYHTRPPTPYHRLSFGARSFAAQSDEEQYQTVLDEESHEMDLVLGKLKDEPGGYAHLKDVFGYAPYVIGISAPVGTTDTVARAFTHLGASLMVVHSEEGNVANLGDVVHGLFARPEHVSIKLFERIGEDPEGMLSEAFVQAAEILSAHEPFFVGIKMHDNDFFAEDSAWTTVYLSGDARRNGPPYDLTQKSALLSEEARETIWQQYEDTVAFVSEHYRAVNAPAVLEQLQP